MEKVRPWCGQPSDRGRLRNRTEQSATWRIIHRDSPGGAARLRTRGRSLPPSIALFDVCDLSYGQDTTRLNDGWKI